MKVKLELRLSQLMLGSKLIMEKNQKLLKKNKKNNNKIDSQKKTGIARIIQ